MANKDVNIQIRAIDKTKKGFASATRGLKMIAGAALNMKTALVGAAGVAGMGLLISRSLSATDALSKTATRIGTTTESLSRLQYAAKISGVETQTLNMAMQRFGRRASEAAVGTGEARGALKELRLNASDLIKLPLDEQMIKLAQAFEENIDPIDRTRIAMKLFDSEGVALLQMTELGAAGMRELFKEAEMLGAVMSSDAAKGVEDANDAMTKLFTIFKGVTDQMTAALAPALEGIVTHLRDLLINAAAAEGGFSNLARVIAGNMIGAFVAVAEGAETMINGIITSINFMRQQVIDFQTFTGTGEFGALAALKEDLASTETSIKAFYAMKRKVEAQAAGVGGIVDPKQMKIAEDGLLAMGVRLKELQSQIKGLEEAGVSLEDFGLVDLDEKFGGILTKLTTLREELAIPIVAALPELPDPGPIITPWEQAISALNKGFNNIEIDGLQKKMDNFADTTVKNMSAGLMSVVEGTASLKDAFKLMVKNLIMQAIQLFIIDKITGGFISFMKNMTGNGKGLGGGGTTGKAIGGPVQAGQPYMVGERGPEMFIPSQGGSIASNKKMGGGGITVVNNVDARGSGADVDQKIKSAMAQSSQQTIITIQDLMRRRRFA
jgi:hypothetical protein